MKLFYQIPNSGWLTRSLTLLTMLLLLTPAVRAQFVVIGGEAITTNGLGSDPVDDFYNFMHYQTVYTAVELSAAGMTPNSEITALGFSVSEDNGPAFPTYTVRMGHTSATNSAAHDASALTNVFGPASYNATATAVGSHDMITLANTFIWDGSSNILVDVCTGNSSMSFGSPYGGVRAENKVNGSRFVRIDNGSTQCAVNTTTTNDNRPQIRFNYIPGTPLACPQLFEIALENPSQTSVDVTFTDATGDVYVEYGITPFEPGDDASPGEGTVIGPVGSPANISGLTANTNYTIYLRQDCGIDGFSQNATLSFFSGVCNTGGPTSGNDSNVGSVNATGLNGSSIAYTAPCNSGSGDGGYLGVQDLTTFSIEVSEIITSLIEVAYSRCDGGSCFGGAGSVWIDWNEDLVFSPGELVGSDSWTFGTCILGEYNISVPPGTSLGTKTMRVIQQESGTLPLDPCATFLWGSVMDFSVEVVAPPDCSTPEATFTLLPDCDNTQFSIEVELINTGSSSEVNITNDIDATEYNGVTAGTYIFGPFAAGNDVIITVEHLDDAICTIQSQSIGTACELCTAGGPTSVVDSNIESVEITGFAGSSIVHDGCTGGPDNGYIGVEDLTALSVDIPVGFSYDLTVEFGSCDGSSFGAVGSVWVDWNGDYEFSAEELIGTANVNPTTGIFAITPPPGTPEGEKILRVMWNEGGSLPLDPCASFSWGSVMDFTVNVISDPGCTPPAGSLALNAGSCDGDNEYFIDVTVSDVGDSPGGEITISNNFDSNTIENATPGNYVFGPFPSGTIVSVDLEHLGNALCTSTYNFSYTCPPPNDNCEDVTPVVLASGVPEVMSGNSVGATGDGVFTGGTMVWEAFEVTGTCNNVIIEFCGNDPAFVAIYTSLSPTCPSSEPLVANSLLDWDICGDGNPTLVFNELAAGTYYYPVAGDAGANVAGPYSITVTSTDCPPPPTDDCVAGLSASPGATINSTLPPATSVINVGPQPEGAYITDLDVVVAIDHTFLADLTITLTSPCGTTITLMDGSCGVNDNMNALFDDEAADEMTLWCSTRIGAVIPMEALEIYDTELIEGDWTLEVTDNFAGDNGTLIQWCLVPTLDDLCLAPQTEVVAYTDQSITIDLVTEGCTDPDNYETFDLVWTGGGSANGVTMPYEITGLDPGTLYVIDVSANCTVGGSSPTSGITGTTLNCTPEESCTYELTLSNTGGTGWGGAIARVSNGWTVVDYVMDENLSTQTWIIFACPGNPLSVEVVNGGNGGLDNNFTINLENADGAVVYSEAGPEETVLFSQADACPDCAEALNIEYTRLAADLVELTWTNVELPANVDDIQVIVSIQDIFTSIIIADQTFPSGTSSASMILDGSYPFANVTIQVITNCTDAGGAIAQSFTMLPACNAVDQCEYMFNMTSTGDGWGTFGLEVLIDGSTNIPVGLSTGAAGTQSVFACEGGTIEVEANVPGNTAGCTTQNPDGVFPWPTTAYTPVCNGAVHNIDPNDISWTGEYSEVNVVAGNQYTFDTDQPGYFITITDGNNTTLATGSGSANWTAGFSGTIRFWSHLTNDCDFANDNHTRRVSCSAGGAPGISCSGASFDMVLNPDGENATMITETDFCNFESGQLIFSGPTCPSCFPVLDVTADNIGVDDVDISWTSNNPDGTDYTIYIGLPGFTPGVDEVTSSSGTTITSGSQGPVNISGLSDDTNYEVIIVEDCGTETNASAPVEFTTEVLGQTCLAAVPINCGSGQQSGNTSGIPNDNITSGAPGCETTVGTGGQMWYEFTTGGINSNITLATCGSTFDTKLHVYTGECGALTCVTSNDDFCGVQSQVSFDALAGETYYVRVGGFNTAAGDFVLDITCGPAIPCFEPGVIISTSCAEGGFQVSLDIDNDGTATDYDVSYTVNDGPPTPVGTFAGGTSAIDFGTTFTFGDLVDITVEDNDEETCTQIFENITQSSSTCPPANDNCANATIVIVNPDQSCSSVTPGTIEFATASSDLNPCGGTADDDVWFSFVATNAVHSISLLNVTGGTTDLYHAVYSGSCGALTNMNCSDPNNSSVAGLTIGNTYYIRVYSWTSTSGQTTDFNVCVGTPPPPPANDECSAAVALTVNTDLSCASVTPGTIAWATGSAEPNPCFGTDDDDVWYSFTATEISHVVSLLNVSGSATDLYHAVYSGSCGSLVNLVCSDPNTSTVSGLTIGDTYLIRVYTYTSTGGQNTTFNICVGTNPPPPVNDLCSGATVISCGTVTSGTTQSASSSDAPAFCGTNLTTAPGIWYLVEGVNGQMTADLCGADYDSKMGVYSGSCGALSCVIGEDDDFTNCGGNDPSVSWASQPGVTYYIYVTGFSTNSGNFDLTVDCVQVPDNNDCIDAQNLSVATFPAINNALGTLSGASNSGTPACTGSSAGGDVYYTFTTNMQNHVAVTVNPFSGADVVVEVLDACSGNTIACIDNGGDAGIETELMENLPAGTYFVRVHSWYSSPEPSSSANFLVNVQQFPFAGVQDNPNNFLYACNQTGFQLEDFVGATPQTTPWVLDYQWFIAEEGGSFQNEWQRMEPNYATRITWLGMEYGKTYNVFVRVLINHPVFGEVWSVYPITGTDPNAIGAATCTISMASNVTPTEVRPNYSPTNVAGNLYALCDFVVAYNVSESQSFHWRFDPDFDENNGNELFYFSASPSVRLSWVPGLLPGAIYQVAVEVKVQNQWSGFSTVLPIELALPPNTVAIRPQFCNTQIAPNGYIMSQSVCEADNYTFEFTPQGGGTPSVFTSGNYVAFLNNVNPSLTPGLYDVRVKVTQNGVAGDFGPICVIEILGPDAPEAPGVDAMRSIAETTGATLYPNPNAGSEVRVELSGIGDGNHDVNIVMYDIYGKQISSDAFGHEGDVLNSLIRFDENLSMGMYLVHIFVDGEQFAVERLVVK